MTTSYDTVHHLIEAEILPLLGGYDADFDIDAITAEMRDTDMIKWTPGGFILAEDDEATIWALIAQHDMTSR